MKITSYLPVVTTALAINFGGFASAVESPLLEHKLTVSLTELMEGEYNETSKSESIALVKNKISNKEILEFFAEMGEIESIKGWSIVAYTENGNYEGYYLVNKEGGSIDATDWFVLDGEWDDYVYSYSESKTSKGALDTEKGNETYYDHEGFFSLYYEDGDSNEILELEVEGVINWLDEYTYVYDNDLDEYTTSIYNITELSIYDGSGYIENGDNYSGVVNGSVSYGKGKVVELD